MNFIDFLLYFVFPLAIGIFLYFKRKFSYFKDRGIPHVKPTWPYGNMALMGTKFHLFDLLLDVYSKCKGKDVVCGFYNLTQPVYIVTDLEMVKHVMVKDFSSFVNRGFFNNEENEPLSGNLLSLEDDRWRFLRNKLSPAFSSGKIKAMCSTILDKGNNLISAIEKASTTGHAIELKDIANRFTVDIISSVAFGMETNTLNHEHERFVSIFKEIFGSEGTSTFAFLVISAFPKIAKFLKLRVFSKNMSEFFMETISSNIKFREDLNDNRSDFLNMLIQLKNKGSIDGEFSTEKKKLTLNEIVAQAFLFFFAGADTTSTTISFALVELSRNAEIQDKLRQEIEEKTKETKGEITYVALMEMTYLNQVVNETLRMFTPGFVSIRKAGNDYQIPGTKHVIPRDTPVWIPSIAFHYDERFFKNPQKFDPEHFSAEENAKRPAYVYTPFGEGPRNCIGMRFGLVNVKYGIATIIKNFMVTPSSKTPYPIRIAPRSAQLEALGGFWMKFDKINQF